MNRRLAIGFACTVALAIVHCGGSQGDVVPAAGVSPDAEAGAWLDAQAPDASIDAQALDASFVPAPDAESWDAAFDTDAPSGDGAPDAPSLADAAHPAEAGGPAHDSGASGADAGPSVPGTVTIDRSTRLGVVGPGFAGFSYEKSSLFAGLFSGSNSPLVALFDRLGPGLLRVGGDSVDTTTYSPGGVTASVITPADIDALAAFLRAADWKVIYGINMKTNTPDGAAAEAAYAASSLGDRLYGFEIGNEPDLYKSTLLSPTWSPAVFETQWQSFAAAIRARVPGATLTGPASASDYKTWTVPFADAEASSIRLLTQHYYRANGKDATSTLALLLAPDPALAPELEALQTAATTKAIPDGYRLAEANSFYNGGASGVSDGYGTALWVIDFLFTNAMHGSSGVNFHGGGDGTGYTPIADANGAVVGVRPDYYGMLLFSMAETGTLWPATVSSADTQLSAHAIGHADGSSSIVLVNADPVTRVHATVELGAPATGVTTVALTGPSLAATSGYVLGGAPVQPSGAWAGAATTAALSGTTSTVDVPPAAAVLLTVSP